MSIRSGDAYRRGLVDSRSVWFRGREVSNVGSHPAFCGKVNAIAALFDAKGFDPAGWCVTPDLSSDFRPSFLLPRDVEGMARRRGWSEWIAKSTLGLMGRSPDYLQTAIMSFASAHEYFERSRPGSGRAVKELHRHAAENDLFLARATVGPATNRGKAYSQQNDPYTNVRVVRESDSGILLRGSKMISTNAAIADELLVFPISGFQPGDENYALAFMIPISSEGLRIVCRDAYDDGTKDLEDLPISTRFEESDSLCVFDDVFVPWDRVFLYRDIRVANAMYAATCSRNFTGYQTLLRCQIKSEFYTAVAIACAEVSGCDKHLHVQEMLGELISYCDVVRGLLALAEKSAYQNEWGVFCPSAQPAQSARVLFPKFSARMVEVIQTIAAGTLFALPTKADLDSPMGELVERAFQSELNGWSAAERITLSKIAWELVISAFGQRQLIYEKYHAGDPFRIAAAHFAQLDHTQSYALIAEAINAVRGGSDLHPSLAPLGA